MTDHLEPYLEERIAAAKASARAVFDGYDESSLIFFFRSLICEARRMGIFDPYFEKRTLDDLVFEVEIIRLARTSKETKASELLKAVPKEEAEGMFDDWVDADTAAVDSKFDEDAKKFMQSGEFK